MTSKIGEITLKRKIIECKIYSLYSGTLGIIFIIIGGFIFGYYWANNVDLFLFGVIPLFIGFFLIFVAVYFLIELIKFSKYYQEGLYIKSKIKK